MFDHRVARSVDPPCPVLLDPGALWPPSRLRWGIDTPLIVRAQGLQLSKPMPGMLRAWVRSQAGDRLGLVDCVARVNGVDLPLSLLAPAAALRQDSTGQAG